MTVKYIAYDVPLFDQTIGEHMGNKVKALTEQEAIEHQKALVAKVRPEFKYESDQQALEDFIAVNWAWYVVLE
jgi:hypothetical protein